MKYLSQMIPGAALRISDDAQEWLDKEMGDLCFQTICGETTSLMETTPFEIITEYFLWYAITIAEDLYHCVSCMDNSIKAITDELQDNQIYYQLIVMHALREIQNATAVDPKGP